MEILSLPGPDWSISNESMERRVLVSKRYRNRRIGDFLKELEIVEGRNTGVPLIIQSMKNNGSSLPVFETDEERSYFSTVLPIHPIFLKKKEEDVTATIHTEKNKRRRTRDELKSLILTVLQEKGSLSVNQLSSELGYARRTPMIKQVIRQMIEDGELAYLYPDKPNSRRQKICLKDAR